MRSYSIAVLAGDGVGPEVMAEGIKVLRAVEARVGGFRLEFQEYEAGAELYRRTGVALPAEVFDACRKADAIYFGAMGLPEVKLPDGSEAGSHVVLRLRFDLELYAGLRPIKLFPGIRSVLRDRKAGEIDYLIVRENTEGLYASFGGGSTVRDDIAIDVRVVSRQAAKHVISVAFQQALLRRGAPGDGTKRVTCVDKSNVLHTDVFFRSVYESVSAEYPTVEKDYSYIDAMTLNLIHQPQRYDVIVCENSWGDILSDLGAGTVGGMGMAPSGDLGENHAVFQPCHGTAPGLAGKGVVNPIATILSGKMMLEWLGGRHRDPKLIEAAQLIERAVEEVLERGTVRTPDLGGESRTPEVGDAVASRV